MNFYSIPRRLQLGAVLAAAAAAATPAHAAKIAVGCPWVPEAININTHNFGYPDAAANYSVAVLPTQPAAGTTVRIHGQYPQARYFSFQVADGFQLGNLVDQIADSDLVSDSGQPVPAVRAFLPLPDYSGYGDSYTITVKFEAPPTDPSAREPNTLYAGQYATGLTKQIVMRVYLPNSGANIFGNVALPDLVYQGGDGDIDFNDTPDAKACGRLDAVWDRTNSLAVPAKGKRNIRFMPVTLGGRTGGLYPNGDSTYLRAQPSTAYGQLVVIHLLAPSFPPQPPATADNPDVRYWSVCQNQLNNTKGVGCVADRDMVLQSDDTATVVISPPNAKPATADAAHGYNWLKWGSSSDAFVAIRQILARSDFPGDFNKAVAEPYTALSITLGEWAPQITYCDAATFDAHSGEGGAAVMEACRAAQAAGSSKTQ